MARTPEPPDLRVKKSLLRFCAEIILRVIILTWLYAQAIGFLFYMIWHNSSVAFREFMFRDFINLWQNYSRGIFPSWFLAIPTWKDPLPWIILGLLIAAYFWGNRGLPRLNFKVERYHQNTKTNYDARPQFKSGNEGIDMPDDDFAFDPSAFKDDKKQAALSDTKRIEDHSKVERKRRLKALADHPNTSENERKIAKQKLKKLSR